MAVTLYCSPHRYDLRRSTGSSYTFNLANRIYIDAASPVRDCIKNILFREIAETDFRNVGIYSHTFSFFTDYFLFINFLFYFIYEG